MNFKGRLNGLDLFSGIAGNTIALREWVKTVAYCDFDRHARAVLLSRMADGSIEPAPIWDDISTLRAAHFDVPIDIIVGGFPCQDISVAGRGAGLAGERSGLVFEVFRLIAEFAPAFVFLENVPAIRTRGGERVVKELAALGYDCRWDHLSAYDVGAPHKRERWFLLGYRAPADAQCDKLRDEQGRSSGTHGQGAALTGVDGTAQLVADDPRQLLHRTRTEGHRRAQSANGSWWLAEPDVGRVANGVPARVDRLRRLGNAVVPAQAREAFRRLLGLK